MVGWIKAASSLLSEGQPIVLVTVAGVRGSSPREVGARMIVTPTETLGTIGGGQLEYRCTRIACGMLTDGTAVKLMKFPLGSSMGQCCGGVVDILFEPVRSGTPGWLQHLRELDEQHEPFVLCTHLGESPYKSVITQRGVLGSEQHTPGEIVTYARRLLAAVLVPHGHRQWLFEPMVRSDFNVAVFGAGHVGTAVVRSLYGLDCNIRWIDSRRNAFRTTLPGVRTVRSSNPPVEAASMPSQSFFLVMTHSHPLDFEITDHILRRGDAAYCGLIGSRSKRRRFEHRFRQQGMSREAMNSLVCPIGVAGITGKKPAEIAVAVAAEVLRAHEESCQRHLPRRERTISPGPNIRSVNC